MNCEESLIPFMSAAVVVVVVVVAAVDGGDDAFKNSCDGDDGNIDSINNNEFREERAVEDELDEPEELFVCAADVVDDGEILFASVRDENDVLVTVEKDVQEVVGVADSEEKGLSLGFGEVPTVEVAVAVPVAVRLGFEVEVDVIVFIDVIDEMPLCKALIVMTEVALSEADETIVTVPDAVDDPEGVDVNDARLERVHVTIADAVKVLICVPIEEAEEEIDPVADALEVTVIVAEVDPVSVCNIVAEAVAERVTADDSVDKDDNDANAVTIEDDVRVADTLITEVRVGEDSEEMEGKLDGVVVSVLKALCCELLVANTS